MRKPCCLLAHDTNLCGNSDVLGVDLAGSFTTVRSSWRTSSLYGVLIMDDLQVLEWLSKLPVGWNCVSSAIIPNPVTAAVHTMGNPIMTQLCVEIKTYVGCEGESYLSELKKGWHGRLCIHWGTGNSIKCSPASAALLGGGPTKLLLLLLPPHHEIKLDLDKTVAVFKDLASTEWCFWCSFPFYNHKEEGENDLQMKSVAYTFLQTLCVSVLQSHLWLQVCWCASPSALHFQSGRTMSRNV